MFSWPVVRCNKKEICEVLRIITQSKGEIFNKVYYHSLHFLLLYIRTFVLFVQGKVTSVFFFFTYFMLLYHSQNERQWDPMLIMFKWTCKHLLVNISKSRETDSKIRKSKAGK